MDCDFWNERDDSESLVYRSFIPRGHQELDKKQFFQLDRNLTEEISQT